MNTIQQHKKQVNEALTFLGKAKFTSAENLQMAAGRNRRGFPTQLKKLGLIVSREMAGSHRIHGLSKLGASTVGVPQYDIHKVLLGRAEHALIAQFETLKAVKEYGVIDYEFEPREFIFETRPDVIWVWSDMSKTYIEIELSAKTPGDGDLDKFFLKLLSRKTIVIFKDQVIFDRYIMAAREYMKSGISDWKLLNRKWVMLDELIKFDKEAWSRIEFKLHRGNLSIKLGTIFDAVKFGF